MEDRSILEGKTLKDLRYIAKCWDYKYNQVQKTRVN